MKSEMDRNIIIANQISLEFGEVLRNQSLSIKVIDCLDVERPWLIPPEAEVLITTPYPAWETDQAHKEAKSLPNLKWVQIFSTGIERHPKWLLKDRLVGCGRGQTSAQIAEFALAAMLLHEKRLNEIRAYKPEDWLKKPVGTLEGKTLGIIGFGSIGTAIARLARPFGMKIVACRRGKWPDELPDGVAPLANASDVLKSSDHVVVALPLTNDTHSSLDEKILSNAKPGLHLINISRGAVIVQDDLLKLLNKGQIGFATLDVTNPEPLPQNHAFWSHERVFLTPHVSFSGGDHATRFLDKILYNLAAYRQGTPMKDLINVERGY